MMWKATNWMMMQMITVTRDGANNFTLRYKKTANSSLTVVCRDIDTMADIETKTIPGNTGESVSLAGICPDGYEAAGELPESATISSNESNNTIYLYYKKIVEKPDVKKEVPVYDPVPLRMGITILWS